MTACFSCSLLPVWRASAGSAEIVACRVHVQAAMRRLVDDLSVDSVHVALLTRVVLL